MQRSLAASSIECAQLLDKVSSLLHNPECEERSALVHDQVEDQSGRFRIWAGNLGAFQRLPATSSLDHRLRESPKVAVQVQELLRDLQDALQNVFQIASGERPNRQYDADDDNESSFGENKDDDIHHDATDLAERNEQDNGPACLSESQELFESVKETITSLFLFSIAIRNASPRDRFTKALSSKQTQFDDSFDMNHVSHKFPRLNTKENQWLKERLGKAITYRRQYLRYARDHRYKLGKEPTDLWQPEDQEKPSATALTVDLGEQSRAGGTNFTKPTSTLAPTAASTLYPSDMQVQEKDFQDDQSQTSYALSLGDNDDESHLQLPRLSDVAKGTAPFECPLCWTIQNITRESSWRKHGFSDLRPYVCTFEKCDVKLFSNRRDWFDHEMRNHRIQWCCHFCKDGFQSFDRIRKHIRHHHIQDITDDQLDSICEASKQPIDRIPASDCPFCDEWDTKLHQANPDVPDNDVVVVTPSQFRHHVGSHMQQLALFAIPRGYLEDDAEVGSSTSVKVVGIDKGELSSGHSSLSSFKSVHSAETNPFAELRTTDPPSVVARAITIYSLSLKILSLCFHFYTEAEDMGKDIERFKEKLTDIRDVLKPLTKLLDGLNSTQLLSNHKLLDTLQECRLQLQEVYKRLQQGEKPETVSRLEPRILKWPFTSEEGEGIVANLEKYEQTFFIALQNHQTTQMAEGTTDEDENRVPQKGPLEVMNSMADLASSYRDQERWKEADELEVQVMKARNKELGEEHPETLTSMTNLALSYRSQGLWKEAEELLVQVIETSKRILGEEHPSTLASMTNLASTYWNLGRQKEAEELEMRVIEMKRRVLGEDHPETLTSMANLALMCKDRGWWKEAEELEVQVMETRKRVLGEDHLDTLTSISNLALTYRDQERWKEAEQLNLQVLEARRRLLGEEHPGTLISMENLASIYKAQEQWKKAEVLEVRLMETKKRLFGEEDVATLISMARVALIYKYQRRWKEAEALEVRLIDTKKRALGEEHQDTLNSMDNLVSTYMRQERWKEAEELEVFVVNMRGRVLGKEHLDTLSSMGSLASIYKSQGRWMEAGQLEEQVVEVTKKELGESHHLTLHSMASLATTYRNQGRWEEAEQLEVQVIETRRKVLGKEHPDTLTGMINLALTYKSQGRWNEAEQLIVQVMEKRKELGEGHPSTLYCMTKLASMYKDQGRWKEAEQQEVKVIEMRKKKLGKSHYATLTSMENLALTYGSQGRWKEAEQLQEQVMETRKKTLGENHHSTLHSMFNLALIYGSQRRLKEAEQLGVQVMETSLKQLGRSHSLTLNSMANLASTYESQGRWEEAKLLREEVMERRKILLGEEHPDTLTSMASLANSLRSQGCNEEAISLMGKCCQLLQRTFGSEHPHTTSSLEVLNKWKIEDIGAKR